jgi:hypothetical protein
MNQRTFLEMSLFERAWHHVGRRRHPQPAIVCHWRMMELQHIAATDLLPFADSPAGSHVFSDLYATDTTVIRRCRKTSGSAFRPSDLECPAASTLLEYFTSIRAEPDHPLFPMIGLFPPELPIVLSSAPPGQGADEALKWLERLVSVDGEICVPTLAPTLAVSLDQESGHLTTALSVPQSPSPALHSPTVHFSYQTSEEVIAALAADLGVQYVFTQPPATNRPLPTATVDEWITKTLADFHHYVSRKGRRGWPADLPFDVLTHARQHALYAVPFSPRDWLGYFLRLRGVRFGHLAGYIDGLQSLLLARYRVTGENPPSTLADALTGFRL